MRQRAGIAQILLRPAPIIIIDEPTAGLDPARGESLDAAVQAQARVARGVGVDDIVNMAALCVRKAQRYSD